MSILVVTKNSVEGYHRWPGAPKCLDFLFQRHRHVFEISCAFAVEDADREIEIFTQQQEIQRRIAEQFGTPAEFDDMSCEHIAMWLLDQFPACVKAKVLEDGFGGAVVMRKPPNVQ
ncbi:MAG: hypothetical protein FWB76_00135 [Oscillospiraceae bacterium]|nr:hypothetical protein [Oscillospiraceae bacterium]